MTPAERARERLQADIENKLEPYRGVLESADMQCDLERQIDSITQELLLAQQQLAELRIANANWRTFVKELMAEVQSYKTETSRGRKETSKLWSRLAEAINDSN